MTIEETNTSKLDIKYQFRCTTEERDFFQEEVAKSGLKPLQFFKTAIETLKVQSSPEESSQKKALTEIDNLTNRLNQINRSQLILAFEMQEQAKNELQELNKAKEEFEDYKKSLELKLWDEFDLKSKEVEAKFNISLLQKEELQKLEIEEKEKEFLTLKEEIENQSAKYNKILNDYVVLNKQFDDKNKLNIAYEEREYEAKKRIMELEAKVKKHDVLIETIHKLEIQNAVLISKNENLSEQILKFEKML